MPGAALILIVLRSPVCFPAGAPAVVAVASSSGMREVSVLEAGRAAAVGIVGAGITVKGLAAAIAGRGCVPTITGFFSSTVGVEPADCYGACTGAPSLIVGTSSEILMCIVLDLELALAGSTLIVAAGLAIVV